MVVAKHGNRAQSSRSGSHDVIESLGLDPAPSPETAARCLREAKLAFLFAPAHHAATRHVGPPRKEVGVRTIFNLLGPLTNPCGAKFHVNGIFSRERCEILAEAHGALGSKRAMVVHGAGGLDEFAPAGSTFVAELANGDVRTHDLRPADFGLDESDPIGLRGGEPADNARIALEILRGGGPEAAVNATLMTAGAALYVAGAATDLRAATKTAREVLTGGGGLAVLETLRRIAPRPAARPRVMILDDILARTRSDLAERKRRRPIAALETEAGRRPAARSLARALRRPGEVTCIAEFKRKSPSAGWIAEKATPAEMARAYAAGGARAMSVLTDGPFFGGSLDDLAAARAASELVILRKDFIVDRYQVVEARAAGADAILLIVSALGDLDLAALLGATREMGLEALVEAHDADEVARAVAAGAGIIGINNRDLRTFTVDRELAARLRPPRPRRTGDRRRVGDPRRRPTSGGCAPPASTPFWSGETLMRAADPAASLRALLA